MKTARLSWALLIALPIVGWMGHVVWRHWSAATAPSRTVAFYQDSMHPWIKSDQPGKCTVCAMDLTPIYEGQSGFGAGSNIVMLSPNNITVLNVQTEEAQPRAVGRTLQVAGTLEADENQKTIVAAPAAGRIDDLTIRYPGVEVTEGERLATFYSPELTLEKRRFLVRARMSVQRDPTGGLARPQSDSDPYYSDLISPQSGTVVERKVYKGQYVADGEKMFTIVDLSTLWFRFDVYEQQLPWLALGQTVEVAVPAVPGRVFPAVISFIEPMLNESTRTIKVRADIKNPLVEINGRKQRLLGLGMYAQGGVRAEVQTALAVPRSAILLPGRSACAYVERASGAYERRPVRLGHEGDGYWEVLQGLDPGDRVVTSGNVLIDAQAQLSHPGRADESGPNDSRVTSAGPLGDPGPVALKSPPMPETPAPMPPEVSDPPVQAKDDPPKPAAMSDMDPDVAPGAAPSAKPRPNPRHPVHPAISAANPGFRNSRIGKHDAAFDAAFNRVAELRMSDLSEAAGVALPAFTREQSQGYRGLVAVMAGLAQALAEDDLGKFQPQRAALAEALVPLSSQPGAHPSLLKLMDRLGEGAKLPAPKDLAEARAQFLPLGAAAAEFVRELKRKDPAFAGLKVYHCPMAPKPGLWVQTQGPLHNPFFGPKMLSCGEEVVPAAILSEISMARDVHDSSAH